MVSNTYMELENDILKDHPELRQMPFGTPEGYFESFRCEPWKQQKRSWVKTLAPYAAMAAMFAFIAIVGAALLERTSSYESDIESFAFADLIPLTDPESIYHIEDIDATPGEITDDDIVNYLIYTGISLDSY